MKKFIKENWFKLSLLIIVVLAIGSSFYWFQLRPTKIKQECSRSALESAMHDIEVSAEYQKMTTLETSEKTEALREKIYYNCLAESGL
ncbi:MAG: hypothetical protein PHD31_02315 [Candidatus Pacebacteria bacterium]|nr:hypothetical protein [Candidatus Paceibacterota bacterium]